MNTRQYKPEQLETLRQLRSTIQQYGMHIASKPFAIFTLRAAKRKHPLEFVCASPSDHPVFNQAAIVRLYRGKVRIQFFYANTWPRPITRALVKEFGKRVEFAEKSIWGHRELLGEKARTWKEYATPSEVQSFV
ncbi:MAG: hypothetical protein HY457_02525 [Parcubacteria group bacterium]|nr:hypothetical protein [Parcubacteria group bacterium]